jgi:hypothetical protein
MQRRILARQDALAGYPARMRIDEILSSKRPVFSVEFFPPKSEKATEQLFATARCPSSSPTSSR